MVRWKARSSCHIWTQFHYPIAAATIALWEAGNPPVVVAPPPPQPLQPPPLLSLLPSLSPLPLATQLEQPPIILGLLV